MSYDFIKEEKEELVQNKRLTSDLTSKNNVNVSASLQLKSLD